MPDPVIIPSLRYGLKFTKTQKKFSFETVQSSLPKVSNNTKVLPKTLDFFGKLENVGFDFGKKKVCSVDKTDKAEICATVVLKKERVDREKKCTVFNNREDQDTQEIKTENCSDLKNQQNIQLRKKHKIKVSGYNIPDISIDFSELKKRYKINDYLLANVAEFGFPMPTPIQMQAIPLLLENREVVACAPTGSGKTLAFVLPLFALLQIPKSVGFRSLVLAPTKELARQIYNVCVRISRGKKWRIHLLNKTTLSRNSFMQTSKLDLLISTPMRLVYAIQNGFIRLDNVEWLVLDEADKLLDLGFLEQLDEILSSCSNSKLHCSLFSATISEKVQELARTILRDPVSVFVGKRNTPTETIMQELKYCGREDGKLLAIRQLFNTGLEPPVLIFVQSVDRAKQLFHELVYDNINVDAIHSERTQAQRDSVIRKFRSGDIWVLIATDVLGRGMDFKGVNVVINYDFPTSTANYIHRIGRTGRAGRAGKAITFFTNEDFTNLRSIVNIIKESGGEVPEWLLKFKRPNAKKRKQLEKKPVDREDISIIPNKRKK